jgi:hypothetical protein
VDEDLLALLAVIFRKRLIDGTLTQWIGGPIGARVVHDVVEGPSLSLGEGIAGELLGSRVHVGAVLPIIHHEHGHGRVVEDGIESIRSLLQCDLCALAVAHIAVEDRQHRAIR